jgi:hypothetical protein
MIRWMFVLLLAGCATTATPQSYFARNDIPQPSIEKFPHCRGYGCHTIEPITLNKNEWAKIKKLFPAKSASKEREQIAKAIGLFERMVGPITRTDEDLAGTYIHPGPYQLDCVDESTNTTVYLNLLDQQGGLKFHDVTAPQTRVPFGVGIFAAHRTAVIRDKKTGIAYAVDSWFRDNGKDADIIPVSIWKQHWHPKDAQNVH